jgi:hypothetical protein
VDVAVYAGIDVLAIPVLGISDDFKIIVSQPNRSQIDPKGCSDTGRCPTFTTRTGPKKRQDEVDRNNSHTLFLHQAGRQSTIQST